MSSLISRAGIRGLFNDVARNVVRQPLAVQAVRLLLVLCVYYIELGSFWPYVRSCRGQLSPEAASAPIQLLILTDPQIITTYPHPSYPGLLSRLLFPFFRSFTDRYLARAWRALRSPGGEGAKEWTATVWLGDLTDTGRQYGSMENLPSLYHRFFSIFPDNRPKLWNSTFYIPGNHDTALQQHSSWHDNPFHAYNLLQARDYARWKFLSIFGTSVWDNGWEASPIFPPSSSLSHTLYNPNKQHSSYHTKVDHNTRHTFNARVPIQVAHADGSPPSKVAEMILLDATDVVTLQRLGRNPREEPRDGRPGQEADWRPGGTWWFLDTLAKDFDPTIPRILFTHVPLHRDTSASCELPSVATFPPGVLPAAHPSSIRQHDKGIQPGSDREGTYENLIGEAWSDWIREKVRPSVIFSGDDHDLCHHLHKPLHPPTSSGGIEPSTWAVPELTVQALSLTSGVRTPGYARLSIWQEAPVIPPSSSNNPYNSVSQPSAASAPQTRVSYTACTLPRQIVRWATLYPALIGLLLVFVWLRRTWLRRRGYLPASSSSSGGRENGRGRSRSSGEQRSRPIREDALDFDVDTLAVPRRSNGSRPSSSSARERKDDEGYKDDLELQPVYDSSQRSNGGRSRSPHSPGIKDSLGLSLERSESSSSTTGPAKTGNHRRDGHSESRICSGKLRVLFMPLAFFRRIVFEGDLAREFWNCAWIPVAYWVLLWTLGF